LDAYAHNSDDFVPEVRRHTAEAFKNPLFEADRDTMLTVMSDRRKVMDTMAI
jgi:hypothetical protein